MAKTLATLFFSLVLLMSIVTPTYIVLTEGNCEITAMKDKVGEDEEKKGKEAAKDLEVKNYFPNDNSYLFIGLEKKKRISFYSKNYVSYQKKQLSPPPEMRA
ncbi:hypothetical protein RQM59_02700 [Flavobacteriaceae bacterium S356]|uniref:Transmembrane protein n=1 Tax=Asprobacillus argus TaxID=3076534 RepID=A0ABU3LC23_9FLAO|nr:hypothetical protein [Flavobacteriaceae bacterium S356]